MKTIALEDIEAAIDSDIERARKEERQSIVVFLRKLAMRIYDNKNPIMAFDLVSYTWLIEDGVHLEASNGQD